MIDELMHEIICLADRIDPDPEAVREWFFETPLLSHGKTALELVHADRGDAVIAFLRRILRDVNPDSEPLGLPPSSRAASRHLAMTPSNGM